MDDGRKISTPGFVTNGIAEVVDSAGHILLFFSEQQQQFFLASDEDDDEQSLWCLCLLHLG